MATGKRTSGLPDVRHIRPESIQLGDLINVRFREDDNGITKTATGRVAKREHEGQDRVLITAQGGEIFRWHPSHAAPVVTLLDRPVQETETLMGSEVWTF